MDKLRKNDTEAADACPTRDQLELFSKGGILDELQLLAIGCHLDQCTTCLKTVSESEILVDLQSGQGHSAPSTVETTELREQWERFQIRAMPKTIGKYPNEGVASRGGMSIVYHSTHPGLGRPVVIKSLPGAQLLSQNARLRLIAEQKKLGEINHPTIVAALDADCDNGVPFIVMEALEGTDLSQLLRMKGALPRDEACAIAALIADALQVLHDRNLVHRDVKPGNIFVTSTGQVKLLDLGLAFNVQLEAAEASTVTGTPCFMAPEQADPSKSVDQRSDLFGLGATLYTLLTGEMPIPLNTLAFKERLKEARLPADLQQLVIQMLAVNPESRPASARAVCERLSPYALRAKSIDLRPLANRSSQHRTVPSAWLLGLLSCALLCVLAVLGVSWRINYRKVGEAHAPVLELEGQSSIGSARRFVTSYPRSYPKVAKWNSRGDRIACFGEDGDLRIYGHSGTSLTDVKVHQCFQNTDTDTLVLQWLNDDRSILVGSSVSEPLKILDSESGSVLQFRQFDDEITAVTYSAQMQLLLLAHSSGVLQLVDFKLDTIRQITPFDNERLVSLASFEDRFVGVSEHGKVFVASGDQLEIESTCTLDHDLSQVAWHPTGAYFVIGTNDGKLMKFDATGKHLDEELPSGRGIIRSIAWNHTGTWLAIGSSDAAVVNLETGVRTLLNESNFSYSANDWNANRLLVATYEKGLTQWDAISGKSTTLLESTRQKVTSVAWSPHSDHLAIGTLRGDLFVFDSSGSQESHLASPKHELPLVSVAWSPKGTMLAGVYEWSENVFVSTLTESRVFSLQTERVLRTLCWLNESVLLTAGTSGSVIALDALSGRELHSCELNAPISLIRFREADKKLIFIYEDGGLAIGSVDEGGQVEKPLTLSTPFRAVACDWLAESNDFVVTTNDGRILLMDPLFEKVRAEYHVGSSHMRAVKSSPNGEYFSVGELGCFSRRTFSPSLPFVAVNYAYGWSPDGRWITAGNWIDEVSSFDLAGKKVAWQVLLQKDGTSRRLQVMP